MASRSVFIALSDSLIFMRIWAIALPPNPFPLPLCNKHSYRKRESRILSTHSRSWVKKEEMQTSKYCFPSLGWKFWKPWKILFEFQHKNEERKIAKLHQKFFFHLVEALVQNVSSPSIASRPLSLLIFSAILSSTAQERQTSTPLGKK